MAEKRQSTTPSPNDLMTTEEALEITEAIIELLKVRHNNNQN